MKRGQSRAQRTQNRADQAATRNQDPRQLRRRRVAAGLSLTQAASEAGCSVSHLSKLEHGDGNASPPLLAKLAGVYGCQISDLMPAEPGGAAA